VPGNPENERRKKMTKQLANILLASSAALLMTLPISAQSYRMEGKIPFAFQANGKFMAAGKYEVQEAISGFSSLRAADTGQVVFLSSHRAVSQGKKPARLVFHRYGESYFLSELWSPEAKGLVLPTSAAEKELIGSGKRQLAPIVVMNSRLKAD
jgi:hypothetical protein